MSKGLFRRIKEFFHGRNVCYAVYCSRQATTRCGNGCCAICHDMFCDSPCRPAKRDSDMKIVPGGWR